MSDLYEHRVILFLHLMRAYPGLSWRAKKHHDGSAPEGKFLAGMDLPTGQVTYHVPMTLWFLLDRMNVKTLDAGPKWDGHGSADVLRRITEWESNPISRKEGAR